MNLVSIDVCASHVRTIEYGARLLRTFRCPLGRIGKSGEALIRKAGAVPPL